MSAVKVRNISIGEGIPKICVPIVGEKKEEIIQEAKSFLNIPVDVVEWRIDWFEDVFDLDKVLEALKELRDALGDIPVLVTFRTANEGGEKAIETEAYVAMYQKIAASGLADLIDVELFTGDDEVKAILATAKENDVKVVCSNHDFFATPAKEEIVNRLSKMKELGADIPKIAVMPQNKKDVLTLLGATEEASEKLAGTPIITMSMGGQGVISRLCGEVFGSALTFGAAKKASAPGQMGVADLDKVLNILHNSL